MKNLHIGIFIAVAAALSSMVVVVLMVLAIGELTSESKARRTIDTASMIASEIRLFQMNHQGNRPKALEELLYISRLNQINEKSLDQWSLSENGLIFIDIRDKDTCRKINRIGLEIYRDDSERSTSTVHCEDGDFAGMLFFCCEQ